MDVAAELPTCCATLAFNIDHPQLQLVTVPHFHTRNGSISTTQAVEVKLAVKYCPSVLLLLRLLITPFRNILDRR